MSELTTQQRTHFADSFGPVCRAYGEDPLTSYDYRDVTCGECRHAAPYISALPEHLRPRSTTRTRRRSWPRSMQERV
ncbi:hypothetical protein G5C66_08265 [Nocardioides sp. KC13]|uniref:Uncharacterized protein n=1 Tax=Nocardioides turkmenicus TaxID=2711220 RepID=A0A6M1R4U5_9ACTN|nr:hypothetical protein [Nocardioides sp. KC13]NGN92729.1 hypothetical protein [Nocardioides sp. KC13]